MHCNALSSCEWAAARNKAARDAGLAAACAVKLLCLETAGALSNANGSIARCCMLVPADLAAVAAAVAAAHL
jgi:hypothetical protein